ncbi:MAG: DUF4382 domain-containing protein [Ferroplasma sp.]
MAGKKLLSIIVVIVIIAVVAGGGYYAYHYETTGKLKVSAADTPGSFNGTGIYLTFSAIALHSASAKSNSTGWTNYSLHDKTVNILDLSASNATFLSNISIHAASYNEMKIYIKNVSIVVGGLSITLSLEHPFSFVVHTVTISAHSTTSIVLDYGVSDVKGTSSFNMDATVITS